MFDIYYYYVYIRNSKGKWNNHCYSFRNKVWIKTKKLSTHPGIDENWTAYIFELFNYNESFILLKISRIIFQIFFLYLDILLCLCFWVSTALFKIAANKLESFLKIIHRLAKSDIVGISLEKNIFSLAEIF